ncbi:DNA-binding transcriptional regulator, LacI/PurR family [Saccharopolyspora antimicrobica]|uniref:DNA-binding transcriptional regulator, LacI/PurR family n=1 Tax=Saccharopolyspora antimicrobica TaxID=455193 RepID=A0A1I5BL70_9PSEU|nr:LacI family DNA-binding transcriptional regulator [Saccharopolyspora antimicrobica]RKT86642.1 LacI family transcriptional regulator [Saccharopolyspora antimicrobica]SFN75339.1 DNA-binding transcriptional regulator, LacI/PurR family [Saccharopolyspora antimicrobica]
MGPIRPTIADVARAAGVSRTTVSHALNGIGKVDPRTRERVVQAAAELGYRPSLRAQRLRSGQSRTIGLVSSMPVAVAGGPSKLGFFMEVAAAAAETAMLSGFALVVVPPLDTDPPLDALDIDGAIVIEPDQDDPTTKRLQSRGVPIVTIGPQQGMDLPHVDLRAPQVGRLLLDHLREQGARRIALLMGSGHRSWYVDLAEVYAQFAREHGMPPLVVEADESGGEETGQAACAELLEKHPDVDAICAAVDAFALGAVRAVAERGLRIPDDVRVATRYDGVRARTSTPTLTAVDLNLAQAAASAVELLLANLKGTEVPQVVSNPDPRLVVRESTRQQ